VRVGHALDEGLHRSGVREVARADLAGAAGGLDAALDSSKGVGVPSDEDDMASVLGEALCDGAADAAAGSGDDGDALVDDRILRRRRTRRERKVYLNGSRLRNEGKSKAARTVCARRCG